VIRICAVGGRAMGEMAELDEAMMELHDRENANGVNAVLGAVAMSTNKKLIQ